MAINFTHSKNVAYGRHCDLCGEVFHVDLYEVKTICPKCKLAWRKIRDKVLFENESEDCISRADLIKQMIDYQNLDTVNTSNAIGAAYCVELAENAPSVVPTTEKSSMVGEWRASTVHSGIVKCSVCGYQAGAYAESKEYKYCPNCGAKMRLE